MKITAKNNSRRAKSCHGLRVGPEPGMQQMEAIDSTGDFFRFVDFSTRDCSQLTEAI
jgi:hypothetical protein